MSKLEKSWKDKMMTAMGALAMAGTPSDKALEPPKEEVVEKPRATTFHDFDVPFGKHPMDKFLGTISQLESSGGKNIAHKPSSDPVQRGDSAIGNFAVMPKTVQNVASMFHDKNSTLRHKLGPDFHDEEIEHLAAKSPSLMQAIMKENPHLQNRVARYLALHLHTLHHDNPEKAAFGWRFGSNKTNISDKAMNDSGYVKKFKELYPKDTLTDTK